MFTVHPAKAYFLEKKKSISRPGCLRPIGPTPRREAALEAQRSQRRKRQEEEA